MKRIIAMCLIVVLAISVIGCSKGPIKSDLASKKDQGLFTKQKEIFGIKLYATSGVSDEKLQHATNVLAEYLDNDEDGKVDNQLVHDKMIENGAAMVLFKDGNESSRREAELSSFYKSVKNPDALQDLYDSEISIGGAAKGEFDASYEEILHLITHVGYANAYPDVWGEKAGTEVANIMDVARGGYFETIPNNYPEGAWYTYDDQTADYSTMITEYVYWSLTSVLGAQDFNGRLETIQGEWKLNTLDKVKDKDPKIYELLTKEEYHFPKVLPDGIYQGNQ